jgi:hypothetical protein
VADRIEITIRAERDEGPEMVITAQCYPAHSTAWWSYMVTRDGEGVDTGYVRVDAVPTDPLDGIPDVVADALVAHLRRAEL